MPEIIHCPECSTRYHLRTDEDAAAAEGDATEAAPDVGLEASGLGAEGTEEAEEAEEFDAPVFISEDAAAEGDATETVPDVGLEADGLGAEGTEEAEKFDAPVFISEDAAAEGDATEAAPDVGLGASGLGVEGTEEAEEFDAPVFISEDAAAEGDATETMSDAGAEASGLGAEDAEEAEKFDAPVFISEDATAEGDATEAAPDVGLEASGLGIAANEATSTMASEDLLSTEMFEIANDDIAQLIKAEATDTGAETDSDSQALDAIQAMDGDDPIQNAHDALLDDDKNAATAATALDGGTVRLTPEDVLAALASSVPAANVTEPQAHAAPEENLPEDASVLQETDISAATEAMEPVAASEDKPKVVAVPISAEPSTNEASKIKVRMGEVLVEQLTIEEVAAMAEEGKLEEHHLVARQFSENWIEAPKVPVLRPIYERLRRSRQPQVPPPPTKEPAPKGGLFGRLFGRN